ncbi:Unconventional myosin-X [Trichinella pseudospiralis]
MNWATRCPIRCFSGRKQKVRVKIKQSARSTEDYEDQKAAGDGILSGKKQNALHPSMVAGQRVKAEAMLAQRNSAIRSARWVNNCHSFRFGKLDARRSSKSHQA